MAASEILKHEEGRHRVKTVLENVVKLARNVLNCVLNNDPKHIPTKLGMNSLMYYVSFFGSRGVHCFGTLFWNLVLEQSIE